MLKPWPCHVLYGLLTRTVHWGSANRDEESRYALYLNFKKPLGAAGDQRKRSPRSDFQGTSPDEMAIEGAQRRCRVARERFREKPPEGDMAPYRAAISF